tara:strand:+ start:1237 stop:2115 length:879 start_codon:yes stop_codon:yes gene_type:complete
MNSSLSRSCRVCKSTNNILSFKAKNYNQKNTDIFEYFTCNECNSLFLGSIPHNINKYYSEEYHVFKSNKELSNKDKINIKLIQNLKSKCSLLEVGIGNGNFIKSLKDLGYNCYCLEPHSKIATDLKDSGIHVINEKLENLKFDELNFKVDIIFAWHVVEHLENLNIFIKFCEKLLNKEGYIIISTPNKKSLSYKFYKKFWYHLEAPLHTFLVDEKELINQFDKINFKKVKVINNDYSSVIMSKYGWETSGYYLKKETGKKIHSYLGKILSFFMPHLEALIKKTSQYTIIFKK